MTVTRRSAGKSDYAAISTKRDLLTTPPELQAVILDPATGARPGSRRVEGVDDATLLGCSIAGIADFLRNGLLLLVVVHDGIGCRRAFAGSNGHRIEGRERKEVDCYGTGVAHTVAIRSGGRSVLRTQHLEMEHMRKENRGIHGTPRQAWRTCRGRVEDCKLGGSPEGLKGETEWRGSLIDAGQIRAECSSWMWKYPEMIATTPLDHMDATPCGCWPTAAQPLLNPRTAQDRRCSTAGLPRLQFDRRPGTCFFGFVLHKGDSLAGLVLRLRQTANAGYGCGAPPCLNTRQPGRQTWHEWTMSGFGSQNRE